VFEGASTAGGWVAVEGELDDGATARESGAVDVAGGEQHHHLRVELGRDPAGDAVPERVDDRPQGLAGSGERVSAVGQFLEAPHWRPFTRMPPPVTSA
jgi:hypothetical protein